MQNAVLSLVVAIALAAAIPAHGHAQSVIDLSKPQTGKSRFVLNADLTPADLGVVEENETPEHVATRSGGRIGPTADRPVAVKAYTRKDGTTVSAHTRSAPGSRSSRR